MEESSGRWKTIDINNKKFLIRSVNRDGDWFIFLTDMRDIWYEKLGTNGILQKCERLNPTLSIEDVDVVHFVGHLFSDIKKNASIKSMQLIEFSEELEDGIFKFSVDLTKGDSQMLWEEVTMPLCLVAGEIQRRQTILLDLVKKKDKEIEEYVLNGAELTRKHIKTKPFRMELFNSPKPDDYSALKTFESMMTLHSDIGFPRKIELTVACSRETNGEPQKPATINENIKSKFEVEKDVSLVVKNEEGGKPVFTESSGIPEERTILSDRGPSKLAKNSNNIDISGDNEPQPKKARSAPALRGKISKKTIHDFIT